MKKLISLLLVFVMLLSLCACGGTAGTEVPPTEETTEATKSPDELLREALVGQWQNVNDGDIYNFQADGTGTHGDMSITYRVENETVYVVEGTASLAEKVFTLDTASDVAKLIPEDRSTYFVAPENYETIAEQIRAEYTSVLMAPEYWSNTQGLNYIIFSENGGGWFLLSGVTLGLNWEWVDNNTIKLSFVYEGTTYSNVVSIYVDDDGAKLINDEGIIQYLPKN